MNHVNQLHVRVCGVQFYAADSKLNWYVHMFIIVYAHVLRFWVAVVDTHTMARPNVYTRTSARRNVHLVVERDLHTCQQRPIYMPKETNEKRPIQVDQ